MKRLLPLSALLATTLLLGACGDEKSEAQATEQDTVLQYQSTPGSVSLAELAQELGYFENITLENVGQYTGGPESIQLVSIGEVDFGGAFNGAIVKSIAKGVPIESVISYYGSDQQTDTGLYVLESSDIDSAQDLIGKKIGMNTLGAHSEFFVTDYLRQGGLNEEQVKEAQPVVIPISSAIQTLSQQQVDAVALSSLSAELAKAHGDIKKIASDVDVYNREFSAGSLFFSHQYIQENPDTVRTFVTGVAKALEWSKEQPLETVVATFESIIQKRDENETIDNLPYFKSFGVPTTGGEIIEDDFTIWIDWLIEKGELEEGVIELDDLYTNEFNNYIQ